MKDAWKILEELSAPPPPAPPTRRERLRSVLLGLAGVLVIVLVVWGSLVPLQGEAGFASWKMLLAAGMAGAFALLVLWKVPQWQVGQMDGWGEKEHFDRVNEARKTLALMIGGLALIASFYAAVLNRNITQHSIALARQKQQTERFTRAIEQMGAVDASGKKNLEVRTGGIYAMERIANESKDDHWPAMEVLAAYVRGNAPRVPAPLKPVQASAPSDARPASDVQTVLTVIARRSLQWEFARPVLDLHETDLRGATLSQARLIRADLRASDLSAAKATEANLIRADLRGADLSWTNLNGAQLTGAD
ncbi:MAG TPA: pentapeptide repeat-containing protein, partial [Terriglobales bacterium]|nr:pentapeptide repeat-containing protein [Terriglobales bacterium]